jgi:hypothetical protein
MKRARGVTACVALALAAVAGAAAAQETAPPVASGGYKVEGQNFAGQTYSGTAGVSFTDDVSCAITWVIAGVTSEGVCIRKGETLSAAVMQGSSLVVVVYDVGQDGTLTGFWTERGTPGVGYETLTPQ